MVEFLGVPLSLLDLSGWGAFLLLGAGVVWQFISPKGNLRTRREVEEVRADRDARLAEAAEWKKAFENRGEVLTMVLQQNHELLALSRVGAHALTSIASETEGTK